MTTTISLRHALHQFEKINLTTVSKNKQMYDIYKCRKCGIVGHRHGFTETIILVGKPSEDQIGNCTEGRLSSTYWIGNRVLVTRCTAQGKAFANCTPGSIHAIVTPPDGHRNGIDGFWIMGVGERVKLLYKEFTYMPGKMRGEPKLVRTKFSHDAPVPGKLVRTKFKTS